MAWTACHMVANLIEELISKVKTSVMSSSCTCVNTHYSWTWFVTRLSQSTCVCIFRVRVYLVCYETIVLIVFSFPLRDMVGFKSRVCRLVEKGDKTLVKTDGKLVSLRASTPRQVTHRLFICSS